MTSIGSDDLSAWVDDRPPAHRRQAWRAVAPLAHVSALVLLLGAVLAVASALAPDRPMQRPEEPGASDAWLDINRPMPVFGLAGTDFARLNQSYRARRQPAGGAREDILTFGEAHSDQPYLGLGLTRLGRDPPRPAPFVDEIGAFDSVIGLSALPSSRPTPLATRFGLFEAADIRISEGGSAFSCLAFRNRPDQTKPLRMVGLLCGGKGHPAARDSLTCVIDRIDLLAASEDVPLQTMFARAEGRRGLDCAPTPLTAAGSRTTWLDANASLPVLRGAAASPK